MDTLATTPISEPIATLPIVEESAESISTAVRIANLIAVVVPFIAFVAVIMHFWGWGFSWIHAGLLVGMYLLTVLGITVGYHRLFTHKAFETSLIVQCIFAILGSMAVQGPLLKWVALHRYHHQHSDTEDDVHSPHTSNPTLAGRIKGAWHAHIGWFFQPDPPDLYRYVKDLTRSRLLCQLSALFPLWVAVGLAIPALIAGLITHSWIDAFLGLLWGGAARIFLVHHVTWSINSVCHLWGHRPYKTPDKSRNNFLFGILALGEGWHNNHHAFPNSARHGFRWWQIDVSYMVIRILASLRLVWRIRLPNA